MERGQEQETKMRAILLQLLSRSRALCIMAVGNAVGGTRFLLCKYLTYKRVEGDSMASCVFLWVGAKYEDDE